MSSVFAPVPGTIQSYKTGKKLYLDFDFESQLSGELQLCIMNFTPDSFSFTALTSREAARYETNTAKWRIKF